MFEARGGKILMIIFSLQFKEESRKFAFVEIVNDSKDGTGDYFGACCCKTGMKGRPCLHLIATYYLKGKLVRPSAQSINRFAKSQGRLPRSKRQLRF